MRPVHRLKGSKWHYTVILLFAATVTLSGDPATRKKLAEPINTAAAELAPSVTADGNTLVFHSNRDGGKGKFDLWMSQKKAGKWSEPVNLEILNSDEFDGLASISSDGQTIYFTSDRNSPANNNLDIFVSHKKENQWTAPEAITAINTSYRDTMPFISFDGKSIYFSSDRPGGSGGSDLYVAVHNADDTFGAAKNMGTIINSEDDEFCPNMAPDGSTFYFASNRDGGLGGFDLYFTHPDKKDGWDYPVNIGIPVNNPQDQLYFAMPANGEFILTSSGSIAAADEDIYELIVPDWLKPSPRVMLHGKVTDAITKKFLKSEIVVYHEKKKLYSKYSHPDNGDFFLVLKAGKSYSLSFSSEDHYAHSVDLDFTNTAVAYKKEKHVELEPIQAGVQILKDLVFFRVGESKLTDESVLALNLLLDLMQKNKNLQITVEAWADKRGDKKKNIALSQKRADEVKKWLESKGIEPDRVVAKGRGIIGKEGQNQPSGNFDNYKQFQQARRADFYIQK